MDLFMSDFEDNSTSEDEALVNELTSRIESLRSANQQLVKGLEMYKSREHYSNTNVLTDICVNGCEEGMILATADCGLLSMNGVLLNRLGIMPYEVQTLNYSHIVHPADRARMDGWYLKNVIQRVECSVVDNFRLVRRGGNPNNPDDCVRVRRCIIWYLYDCPSKDVRNNLASDARLYIED